MKLDSVTVHCPRCGAAVGVPLDVALPSAEQGGSMRVHLEVDDFECRACGLRVYFRGWSARKRSGALVHAGYRAVR